MGAAAIPLSPEDRAILDLESPRIAGHTCKVIVLADGRPEIDELRDAITSRLEAAPELLRRLDGPADAPVWSQDSELDPASHIVSAGLAAEMNPNGLRAAVGELFAQRLDRSRPLWRIDVLSLDHGGSALVWRIHHALADGTTAVRLARAVLFDAGDVSGEAPARAISSPRGRGRRAPSPPSRRTAPSRVRSQPLAVAVRCPDRNAARSRVRAVAAEISP